MVFVGLIPNYPLIHFDFGAIKELPPELEERKIIKPLFLTDQGVVEHGVFKKICDVLPSGVNFALFSEIPENPTIKGIERALEIYGRGFGAGGFIRSRHRHPSFVLEGSCGHQTDRNLPQQPKDTAKPIYPAVCRELRRGCDLYRQTKPAQA